jgi:hypothetical protein
MLQKTKWYQYYGESGQDTIITLLKKWGMNIWHERFLPCGFLRDVSRGEKYFEASPVQPPAKLSIINIFLIFLFLFVIIFTYLQLLSHVSHDLQAMKPLSKLFTDKRSTKFLHVIWLVSDFDEPCATTSKTNRKFQYIWQKEFSWQLTAV